MLQTTLSATSYLVAKRAMVELSPFTVLIWRFIIASSVLAPLLWLTKGPVLPPKGARRSVVMLGLLVGPGTQLLFLWGLSCSIPAHASLLFALSPLGVYLLSVRRGHERRRSSARLGIGVALAGALVLLLGHGFAGLSGLFWGDLLICGAVVCWSTFTTEGKTLIAAYGPLRATGWAIICGGIFLLPLAPFVLRPTAVWHASLTTWVCILYVGIISSVAQYLLWYFALSRTTPSRVAVFSNLQPVLTALAAWAILGDPLGWPIFVGGALVLLGVHFTQKRAPPRIAEHAP